MNECLNCEENNNIGEDYKECVQCKGDSEKCISETDSVCVIYHPDNDKPSKLDNLNLPNMTSAEAIFEAIDDLLGTGFNIPIEVEDTNSIELTSSGAANHKIKADVKISTDFGNNIEVKNNGLFAKEGDGKVKIDQFSQPKYLENTLVGGTDGCVSVSVNKTSGVLQIQPDLNIDCLLQKILNDSNYRSIFCQIVSTCTTTNIQPIVNMSCTGINIPNNTFTLGTSTTYNLTIPVSVVYSGTISVLISSTGNFSINHNVNVTSATTSIIVPVTYNGLGSVGTQSFTIQLSGIQNTSSCVVNAIVNQAVVNCGVNPPSNITVTTTDTSAQITFTHASPIPVNGYRFRFRRTDIVTTFTTVMWSSIAPTTFSLNLLPPNTPHEYIMDSICNDGISFSTSVTGTFNTLPTPPPPPPQGDCHAIEIFNTGTEDVIYTYTTCGGSTYINNVLTEADGSVNLSCVSSAQINSGNGFIQILGQGSC